MPEQSVGFVHIVQNSQMTNDKGPCNEPVRVMVTKAVVAAEPIYMRKLCPANSLESRPPFSNRSLVSLFLLFTRKEYTRFMGVKGARI